MKAMLREVSNDGLVYTALLFVCPACGYDLHMLPVNTTMKTPSWNFDGNLEAPTLSPSILTRWGKAPNEHVCHSFLEAGVFRYLGDCTHKFANQQVQLPDLPDWVVNETNEE